MQFPTSRERTLARIPGREGLHHAISTRTRVEGLSVSAEQTTIRLSEASPDSGRGLASGHDSDGVGRANYSSTGVI